MNSLTRSNWKSANIVPTFPSTNTAVRTDQWPARFPRVCPTSHTLSGNRSVTTRASTSGRSDRSHADRNYLAAGVGVHPHSFYCETQFQLALNSTQLRFCSPNHPLCVLLESSADPRKVRSNDNARREYCAAVETAVCDQTARARQSMLVWKLVN